VPRERGTTGRGIARAWDLRVDCGSLSLPENNFTSSHIAPKMTHAKLRQSAKVSSASASAPALPACPDNNSAVRTREANMAGREQFSFRAAQQLSQLSGPPMRPENDAFGLD